MIETGAVKDPDFNSLDLQGTPDRVAKMYLGELLKGYQESDLQLQEKMHFTHTQDDQRELVVQTGIWFTSLCAHHLLPFVGQAAIGYLPGTYLVGLSKLSRILDHYAARLQIQERLGGQVATFLVDVCEAECAFVLLRAVHQCMECRGVKKQGVNTSTASIRPYTARRDLLNEFYQLVAHSERK